MPFLLADDGVPLHYTSVGAGRPIVLIHAWTMSGRLFENAAALLARDHQVILLDQRSHGRSGRQPTNLTMEQLGSDIHSLIEALDLTGVVLGGWSMGMTACYNYVNQFGTDRLAGLISIDMTPRILKDEGWEHCSWGSLDPAASLEFQGRMVKEGLIALGPELVTASVAEGSIPSEAVSELIQTESGSVPPLNALALWVSMSLQDWRALVPTIDVPFLVMQGDLSRAYPTRVWEYLEQHLQRPTVARFPNCGHSPASEAPERFAEVVKDFAAGLNVKRTLAAIR